MDLTALLRRLLARQNLSQAEARELFDRLTAEPLEPALVAGLLTALAAKGETIDELIGAAQSLRARVTPVHLPPGVMAIDTCGTGGDGLPIFNVSTCVAIVAAAAGATVAKHGNRSNTRPSGSAEVVTALGVNIDADVPTLERCLAECRIAFLYAARLHPAMARVASVRRALGIRTTFNLLGPLANPAGVRRQVVGVNRPELVGPVLEVLRRLGAERAMVVHGAGGLCELSIAGPNLAGIWDGERTRIKELGCEDAGCRAGELKSVLVNAPDESAATIRRVLAGDEGPARELVVCNTSAALWVAGLVKDLRAGAALARDVLDTGAARQTLERWVAISPGLA